MKTNSTKGIILLGSVVLALLGAGCDRTPEPKTADVVPNPPIAAAGESIAIPPSERPPSDAAMARDMKTPETSGNASTPTQANPAELTQSQEKTTMPHTGQVNNHSAPKTVGQTKE